MSSHEPTFNSTEALRHIRDIFQHQVDVIVRRHPELKHKVQASLEDVNAQYQRLAANRGEPMALRDIGRLPTLDDFTRRSTSTSQSGGYHA